MSKLVSWLQEVGKITPADVSTPLPHDLAAPAQMTTPPLDTGAA